MGLFEYIQYPVKSFYFTLVLGRGDRSHTFIPVTSYLKSSILYLSIRTLLSLQHRLEGSEQGPPPVVVEHSGHQSPTPARVPAGLVLPHQQQLQGAELVQVQHVREEGHLLHQGQGEFLGRGVS